MGLCNSGVTSAQGSFHEGRMRVAVYVAASLRARSSHWCLQSVMTEGWVQAHWREFLECAA